MTNVNRTLAIITICLVLEAWISVTLSQVSQRKARVAITACNYCDGCNVTLDQRERVAKSVLECFDAFQDSVGLYLPQNADTDTGHEYLSELFGVSDAGHELSSISDSLDATFELDVSKLGDRTYISLTRIDWDNSSHSVDLELELLSSEKRPLRLLKLFKQIPRRPIQAPPPPDTTVTSKKSSIARYLIATGVSLGSLAAIGAMLRKGDEGGEPAPPAIHR